MSITSLVLLLTFLLLIILNPPAAFIVDPSITLRCHVRAYSFLVSKPSVVNGTGHLVSCYGNVYVNSCWGRCDSSEIGDYKMPFKISHHPVCTYAALQTRTIQLSECEGYPEPTMEVFDAAACTCKHCDSENTSCENFNG